MSNDTKQVATLKKAARDKRAATFHRVQQAIKAMDEQQIPINFESVSKFANVSKTWLYSESTIKAQIYEKKSKSKNNHYMQNQAAMLSKKDKEIDILTKQNKHLRQQIEELNKQLEVAYASLYKNTD